MTMQSKSIVRTVLVSLALAFVTAPATAEAIRLTFEGSLSRFSDPGLLVPFPEPLIGTAFEFSFIVDTNPKALSPGAASTYNTSDISFTFANENLTNAQSELVIVNDVYSPPGIFSAYRDMWIMQMHDPAQGPEFHSFGIVFLTDFDTPTGGPLTDVDFFVPDPANWERSGAFYNVTDAGNVLANVHFDIDTITVTSVPVPAAAWLFGSALLSLAGLRRGQKLR